MPPNDEANDVWPESLEERCWFPDVCEASEPVVGQAGLPSRPMMAASQLMLTVGFTDNRDGEGRLVWDAMA